MILSYLRSYRYLTRTADIGSSSCSSGWIRKLRLLCWFIENNGSKILEWNAYQNVFSNGFYLVFVTIIVLRYIPTHKLLLNSTLCSFTANSCASKMVSLTKIAPFLWMKLSCFIASSTVMPLTNDAMYHSFSGLYLKLVFWWQTYCK